MGTVIAVASGKGGTGKTSVTGAVAACLACLGRRVLCIDMDVGLRGLDLALGLSDQALMDFSDVALGRCSLYRGAVPHPEIPGLYLLASPMTLPPALTAEHIQDLLDQARRRFDYIFIDSPAGLGSGFQLAVNGADRALVVSTGDAAALRDAQRAAEELLFLPQVHLVVNRVRPRLLRRLGCTLDGAMAAAGLPLLGVIPEDRRVILAGNLGRPLLPRRGAGLACLNIAKRIEGRRAPLMQRF